MLAGATQAAYAQGIDHQNDDPLKAIEKLDKSTPKSTGAITPLQALQMGAKAYFAGDKAAAIDPLHYAAEHGQPLAAWKLGQMYAVGDGVKEDDLRAFRYFSQVASSYSEDRRDSPSASLVADSIVALGSYYMTGIGDSPVKPNVAKARQLFTYAASYFGDADAQFNLGNLYLSPDTSLHDARQAARWLKLAAAKGHVGAQAKFGELIYTSGSMRNAKLVGLQWMTLARRQVTTSTDDWIVKTHERAFALASENERRRAAEWADNWLSVHRPQAQAAAASQ
ncbi:MULTISPECIES: tetratricopeptide repeat protein [Pseudovibrio]|uniref:tetratricopeptide repeat protein n=1 Tax=Stappiaceae TaxID=2821832 RepID=UPI002366C4BB|nr:MULTISPECIES: tetratricopeptide repeat protein [Pseudovibrio]MDD7908854.1 tetratricopeptide repeat protein [Pseudovibrio exalbescens]MDX5593828.1 tetratricopeptide repeat protein [Pseudovibrio sp. SPO723]